MSDKPNKSAAKWIWITVASLLGIVVILFFMAVAAFNHAMFGIGDVLSGFAESIFPLAKTK